MTPYLVSPGARQDLNDIWDYIAADSIDAADRFADKLHENIVALARTPGMGHRREDLAEAPFILFWPVGNYLVLYRVQGDRVEIAAVVHGNRDIPSFIRRRGL